MKVYFSNLGCKLNQAEVDRLARQFVAAGHQLAASVEQADLHVVNSCTVTHLAGRDSRKAARRSLRAGVRTVLTGCHATAAPEEAAELGVDLVLPNSDKDQLLAKVHAAFPELQPAAASTSAALPYLAVEVGHQRALVKIEDGCNMGCAFCIIPSTRGRQRSRPPAEVLAEVAALAAAGFPEIVLTGVQISEYLGKGAPADREGEELRLYDLVRFLLAGTSVPRLRLTSIAPWRFDRRLLELYADPRICRHIHLSLQSGSNATLRRMRRPYQAESYADLVASLRAAVPDIAITTDIIAGFPGETAAEHQESLDFAGRMLFAKTHVFSYSPRPGTLAAELPGEVPVAVAKERVHQHLELAAQSERAYAQGFVGRRLGVIWDQRHGPGPYSTGLADTSLRVYCREEAPAGAFEEIEILGLVEDKPIAARLSPEAHRGAH